MSISVLIVWSSEAVALFNRFGLKNTDVLEDLVTYVFDTEDEANAFREGASEGVGWEACIVKEARPRSKISHIAFGAEDSRKRKFYRIDHQSPEIRISYEEGVMAGEGWFDHAELDEKQAWNYRQALAALIDAGLEHTSENLVQFIKSLEQLEAVA